MAMRLALAAAAVFVTSCATTPDVKTDFDPVADFSRYRSYSWIYTQVPQGMNPLTFQRVKESIDRSLQARSFTQSPNGDFAIAFTMGARDRVEVTDFGPYGAFYPGWGRAYRFGWAPVYRDIDVRNVTDGTLAVDIYDAGTKRPVWHGVATQEIGSAQAKQEQLDAAVDALLAKFPPAAAK